VNVADGEARAHQRMNNAEYSVSPYRQMHAAAMVLSAVHVDEALRRPDDQTFLLVLVFDRRAPPARRAQQQIESIFPFGGLIARVATFSSRPDNLTAPAKESVRKATRSSSRSWLAAFCFSCIQRSSLPSCLAAVALLHSSDERANPLVPLPFQGLRMAMRM
jgi:hypothetical protein